MRDSIKTLIAALAVSVGPFAAEASNFGCSGLEQLQDLPSLEGRDGVIFRINADLRMYHPFSNETVKAMGQLSRALAARGTTLIYVPIPTKSVTMPEYLPPEAALYGFDLEIATWVHKDILDRLTAEGVQTVDAREAMLQTPKEEKAFFQADFHWTAAGANETAKAIAKALKLLPDYGALTKTQYETQSLQPDVAFSGMRRLLQKRCATALPLPETMTFETKAAAADLGGALDLFGDGDNAVQVALLGTSFSDSPINNFTGFLAQHSELEVVNYAITGGNQFGAMTSYLTSKEFEENRPKYLIWENPIYNNLAQYGDQPMRELISAATGNCRQDVAVQVSGDRLSMRARLADLNLRDDHTIFVETDGSAGLEAVFSFTSPSGEKRAKTVVRGKRLRRTGRFYMPVTGLWPDGVSAVDVTMSEPLGEAPKLFICSPISEVKS